jgi:hypothetical protein
MSFMSLVHLYIFFINRYPFSDQYASSNTFAFPCLFDSLFFPNFRFLIETGILSLGCCVFLFLLYISRILIHLFSNKAKDFLVVKILVLLEVLAMFDH